MIKISIIMPVFNDEDYLIDAIESVINQTISGIELICINDGSSDKSLEILNDFSLKYDFINVFSQDNKGAGKARNLGLDYVNGEYVAFLDADDFYIDNNALEIMYNVAKSHNADMVSANLISVSPSREILNSNDNCKDKYYCFDKYCDISPSEYGIPWSFYKNIYKKELIESHNIRFPDLSRGEDPIFLAEILTQIKKIYGVPINYYGYMIPKNANNLLNTSKKKLDYIIHYKKTFEILESRNLTIISNKYKKDLIRRLNIFQSQNDIEGYEMFLNIFGLESLFLISYDEYLKSLYVWYLFEKLSVENSQDYFNFVKNEFLKFKLFENNKISKDFYNKITLIFQYDDYQKFNEDCLELEFNNQLQKIKNLTKKNKMLKKRYNQEKKLNDELFNSNSMRISKFFLNSKLIK